MVTSVSRATITQVPTYSYNPLTLLAAKARNVARAIFGYILRLSVFQLGEFHRSFGYIVMRAYQRLMCDPREERPLDAARLQKSKELLLEFGGIEARVHPADGKALVHCMTFKSLDFFKQIAALGGRKIEIEYQGEMRSAIVAKDNASQFDALTEKLKKFFLPTIELPEGKAILLPHACKTEREAPCILRSHSPGRSMCMERRFIGLHLASGYDLCLWDPRGTIESKGMPSEGGYYLDLDAVYEHLLAKGTPHSRIYLSGYCEGAGVNAHLKKKYHKEGVHFIAENPFHNLLDMVQNAGFIGKYFGELAMPEIQSTDPSITDIVEQDGFNLARKFLGLPPSEGRFIIIHTDTDRTVPADAVQKIREAVGSAGPYLEILRRHPNPKANGHMQPPIEDENVWRRYVEVVI